MVSRHMQRSRGPRASCRSQPARSPDRAIMRPRISRKCATHAMRSSRRQRSAPVPRHEETRHLPYTPEQMFDLVADVGAYTEFLPWVTAIRVRSDTPTEMVADMIVCFKGLHETFTSRVHKLRPERVH